LRYEQCAGPHKQEVINECSYHLLGDVFNDKTKGIFWYKIKKLCNIFYFIFQRNLLKPKIKNFNVQNLNCAYFFLSNFNFWSRYFSKHLLKPKFRKASEALHIIRIANISKPLRILYQFIRSF
jgi:hypothetical protein